MVCVGVAVKHTMYQRKVDVDMLNAVKSVLTDVLSFRPSSEQMLCSDEEISNARNVSQHTLYDDQDMHINFKPWPNGLASRRKFWTCVQLAFRLATHLSRLATTCVELR